jgi:hypothetical protein
MPAWSTFLVMVLVVFVAIAPRRVLGPVIKLVGRRVGAGIVALASLGCAIYLFSDPASTPYRNAAYAALAVGGVCAAWWIYRRFVPRYRDQAAAAAPSDLEG